MIETYNKIVNNDMDIENSLKLLDSTIQYLHEEKVNIPEISLLYCLESDYLYKMGLYDEAYKWAMTAYQMDSERKEVLHSLMNIHSPQIECTSNPYEDDEKAKEYSIKLENLYPNDPNVLIMASDSYSILGLYNDSLRVLKQAYVVTKSSSKQNNDQLIIFLIFFL